mmetsp:Transcript_98806/g.282500  ORF Transcript_98806/g.282500 Transcript_98806/m.282500 type:complete len:135 (+) Transcript_98806:277-681(+)
MRCPTLCVTRPRACSTSTTLLTAGGVEAAAAVCPPPTMTHATSPGTNRPSTTFLSPSFAVIITFARDFDPVGTTEIGMLAKLKDEFEARDVKVVAIGVDSKSNHRKWIEEIQELQDCEVYFPIIADQVDPPRIM